MELHIGHQPVVIVLLIDRLAVLIEGGFQAIQRFRIHVADNFRNQGNFQ
jgi:hypothetical protein